MVNTELLWIWTDLYHHLHPFLLLHVTLDLALISQMHQGLHSVAHEPQLTAYLSLVFS